MQFRDLKAQYNQLKPDIDRAISDVIENSSFILGEQVSTLEKELAEYVGRKHCVAVGNGTDALHLALLALGVGEGDAVFAPDFTYVASAVCANLVGATPVLVDINLETFNVSPEALENSIKSTLDEGKLVPKAIIAVDLFGQPADYDEIIAIAKKYNIKVIEDAAQGFGGRIRERIAGSFGDISTTSFFPAKPLGCYGDGGAIFLDDDEMDAYLRSIRVLGRSETDKYDNVRVGTNSRLDAIQAAILMPKFRAFKEYELEAVNKAAEKYTELLSEIVHTPTIKKGFLSSWAQYTVLFDNKKMRDRVQIELKSIGIPTMVYYPRCMHQQGVFDYLGYEDSQFPNATYITDRCLSLPIHPYISNEEIERVTGEIRKVLGK